jgi:serine O-acetyltransferase
MTFKDQLDSLRVDAHVYWSKRGEGNLLNHLLYVITCHGWHVMFWFRVGKIIYSVPIPVVSHILKIIFQINWFFITTFYGIWLDASNNIGKGFYIGHFGGIIVRGDFGDYCSIGQGVTIGSKGAGKSNGCPVFNDNIYVGAGAKIIGKIVIGSGTVVGANAVVTASTPANSLAVGIPAKIIVRDLT